jgi:hypothetical protein
VRVIVTGSRDWSDRDAVQAALLDVALEHSSFTLIHGGCPTGADRFADRWARAAEIPVEVFEADWEKYGKRAGPIRNAEMVQAGADLVLAFPLPGGKGTQHTIRIAREAGIPVQVWGEEQP